MEELSLEERAVFYLGLSELVLPVIWRAHHDQSAQDAVAQAWRWIQGENISGQTLDDLVYADGDIGVAVSMLAERDDFVKNAWGCVSDAIIFVAYCAYKLGDSTSMSEMAQIAGMPEHLDNFIESLNGVVRSTELAPRFAEVLKTIRADEYTRENIRETVFRIARDCGVAVP